MVTSAGWRYGVLMRTWFICSACLTLTRIVSPSARAASGDAYNEPMTDDDIRRLIQIGSEGPNLDYKAGFEWTKDNRDMKYELIRDLIALANTRDGGRVIFGVRDEDLALVGV